MVDDGVDVDTDADGVASADHVAELLLITASAVELVGGGLISLPPWTVRAADERVLVRRRDLDSGVALWSQESLALGSDASKKISFVS